MCELQSVSLFGNIEEVGLTGLASGLFHLTWCPVVLHREGGAEKLTLWLSLKLEHGVSCQVWSAVPYPTPCLWHALFCIFLSAKCWSGLGRIYCNNFERYGICTSFPPSLIAPAINDMSSEVYSCMCCFECKHRNSIVTSKVDLNKWP